MSMIYYIIIYIVIIIVIGFLTAYMIEMHHRDLYVIRDSFHSIAENLKVITKDMEDTYRILEEAKKEIEERNRIS